MAKIRLGGLKLLEDRAYVASTCRGVICRLSNEYLDPLEVNRINLSLFTHITKEDGGDRLTAFCTTNREATAGFSVVKSHGKRLSALNLHSDMTILSLFPHDKDPRISAALLKVLAVHGISLHGMASSPSAISVVLFGSEKDEAIEALFDSFEFSSYGSPYDWHAAYEGQKELLDRVIASYREQVIKVYGFVHEGHLELWNVIVPVDDLGQWADTLSALGRAGVSLPLIVAQKDGPDQLFFSLAMSERMQSEIQRILRNASFLSFNKRAGPIAIFHLHGPHFGDRYGIVNAFNKALASADLELLALSCTISSISGVVHQDYLTSTWNALSRSFQVPKYHKK